VERFAAYLRGFETLVRVTLTVFCLGSLQPTYEDLKLTRGGYRGVTSMSLQPTYEDLKLLILLNLLLGRVTRFAAYLRGFETSRQ